MGSNERRTRQKQALRAKILDAARELFATHGYEAVTMRKVAEKIEYSPTAIYLHFADKTALVRELCDHDFMVLAGQFMKLVKIKDPIERVRKAGYAYVDFAITHPNAYRLMFMTPNLPGMEDSSTLQKGNPEQDAYAFLRTIVQDAVDQGRVRPELHDVEMLSQILWAGVHGIASLHIAKSDAKWVTLRPAKQTTKVLVDVMVRGVAKEEA
jgi:AcrR family transcriptional regulator